MAGRALLIGSALDGLTGVGNDVAAMAEALTARGFTVERCLDADATRDGILAAYDRLIAAVGPDDAAVVYYSGHGGRVTPPDPGTSGPEPLDLQFIVPADFHDSQPGDYRVVTSVELSVLLARLTRKTKNAAVILDCCHSAHMSRRTELRPQLKALPRPAPYADIWAHLEKLRASGVLRTDLLTASDNPDAVRVVACGPLESAYEYDGDDGRRIGVLTESLTMALAAAGTEPVSWATVIDRVRGRVMDLFAAQRPEAEGPSGRLLFQTVEADVLTSLPVSDLGGGRLRLGCAPLLGVRLGDTFAVMPADAAGPDDATKVGDLTVDRVGPLEAQGPVEYAGDHTEPPLGARAHRVGLGGPSIPVLIPDGPRTEALARAVAAAPLLRAAGPGEAWQAAVRVDEAAGLSVVDRIGPLNAPREDDEVGVGRVVRDLNALARAAALRSLAADPHWALDAGLVIEWGVMRDGERSPLPDHGAIVPVGAPMYISIHNGGEDPVYVSILDIGVSGRVKNLIRDSPSGELVRPGRDYLYGRDNVDGVLRGIPLTWADGVDAGRSRPERLLLLATADPTDVSALEQGGVGPKGTGPVSPLQAVLNQIATGHGREAGAAGGAVACYDLHTIEFELQPAGARDPG